MTNDKVGKEIIIHGHITDKQQSHIINKVERWVPEHSHIIDIEWVPDPLVKNENGGENARSKIVYGNVPYNEDSLFSSIVQILNAGDANAGQQKQQQQTLRRLTAEAMLEDSKNRKEKNNYKYDLRREVLEKMAKKRLTSLELANDKALFQTHDVGHMYESRSAKEIRNVEKVLGRSILLIEAHEEIRNWNELLEKLPQNWLELEKSTLVVVRTGKEGEYKYRPLYQIPPSETVRIANIHNLEVLNYAAMSIPQK